MMTAALPARLRVDASRLARVIYARVSAGASEDGVLHLVRAARSLLGLTDYRAGIRLVAGVDALAMRDILAGVQWSFTFHHRKELNLS